ncbi:MAG: hypothetical protein D6805_07250 [Planctomycetota bacterium]|nr:MAG: hypothetical protein D6805_07250 [Planctomycetota bacterium]
MSPKAIPSLDTFTNALDYLYSLPRYGSGQTLERTRILLNKIPSAHDPIPTILVGGTNGKGSVAAALSSIFTKAGYQTGLFSSPHLWSFCERIKINHKDASPEMVLKACQSLVPHLEELKQKGNPPSGFEAFFALAMELFARNRVEIAILEVGLGGRLDPTNATAPLVSILTNVDLEHTEVFGKNKKSILREKLPISRPKRPLLSGVEEKPLQLFMEKETEAQLFFLHREISVELVEESWEGQRLRIATPWQKAEYFTPLLGEIQQKNMSLAVAAAQYLNANGPFYLTSEKIAQGLRQLSWPCRLERLWASPPIFVDCAHNLPAIRALVQQWRVWQKKGYFSSTLLLAGFSYNKPYREMLAQLRKVGAQLILSQASYRSACLKELETSARMCGFQKLCCFPQLQDAVECALEKSLESNQALLITGGLFFAAEARKVFQKFQKSKKLLGKV